LSLITYKDISFINCQKRSKIYYIPSSLITISTTPILEPQ
jgi:hypothetical protein